MAIDREELKRKAAAARTAAKNRPPKYVNMPKPTGDAEADSKADLTELQAGFRARAAADVKRKGLATDSEFWGAVCFQTREQRDAFFAAIGAQGLGVGGRYFDGEAIAAKMGITLPTADVPYKAAVKPDPAWVELTKEK